jgi:glutamate-1-semialdehyde 2,1-aminomutase
MLLTETDLQVVALYADFLPKRVFDAHMHLYGAETIPNFHKPRSVFEADAITPGDYLQDMGPLMPGVEQMQLNMMPMLDWAQADPTNGLRQRANDHVYAQYAPGSAVSPFVLPGDTAEEIEAMTRHPGTRGFKCYCYGVGRADCENVSIDEFLPESLWEVANARKMPIILHMMRPGALSDEDNFTYITRMTKRYPDAQLVLAHCARGFAAWTAVEAIRKLEDQGNIWFDLAAICESGPMMACILKNAGRRTMWGSDYPICKHRGRAVSVGTGSSWLTGPDFSGAERTLIATENLLALKQAALLLDLDATQIQDLFYNNAAKLFRIDEKG